VSVVVPFSGAQHEADDLCTSLHSLRLRDGDEIVLVDNSRRPLGEPSPPVRRLRAIAERSSYYARNVGAAEATNDWVLFLDGDCRPRHADLLDRFFDEAPGARVGALAGAVIDAPDQPGLFALHARTRQYLDQERSLQRARPFALTANVLVRKAAMDDVGGFCEGIRSGGDQDFSWRLRDAGWSVGLRASAAVDHIHQDRFRPALRKFVRYGAGAAWLARRHPGAETLRPPLVAGVGRALAGILVWPLLLQPQRGVLKAIDGLVILAMNVGYVLENRPPDTGDDTLVSEGPIVIVDIAPSSVAGDDSVAPARIEALRRASAPRADTLRHEPIVFHEDDGFGRRLLDALWMLACGPRRIKPRAVRLLVEGDGIACIARRALTLGRSPSILARGARATATAERLRWLVESAGQRVDGIANEAEVA
jgi:glycosyl transferase family 2